jgi:hypothetical protein
MQKTGQEPFTFETTPTSLTLLQFWQWSQSSLLTNTLRGHLAEFVVASALDLFKTTRVEWDAYDLKTSSGIKIEVKSAAYLQSWQQTRESLITFDIRPTQGWDAETNTTTFTKRRQADLYVFCLLHHRERLTINPLSLDQWTFYVLATSVLNEKASSQKTITLTSLLRLNPISYRYDELQTCIRQTTIVGL